MVLVRKENNIRCMSVDFINMNTVFTKDLYPLPNIDLLINRPACYDIMSFMDAYMGYNQT